MKSKKLDWKFRQGNLLFRSLRFVRFQSTIQAKNIFRIPRQNAAKMFSRFKQDFQIAHLLGTEFNVCLREPSLAPFASDFLVVGEPRILILASNIEKCNDFRVVIFDPFNDRAIDIVADERGG